jgi:hypothetical protein
MVEDFIAHHLKRHLLGTLHYTGVVFDVDGVTDHRRTDTAAAAAADPWSDVTAHCREQTAEQAVIDNSATYVLIGIQLII